MIVYVAGPYSADTEEGRIANVEKAFEAGLYIIGLGHWPLIPHLSHYFDLWMEKKFGQRSSSEMYMQWDFAMLDKCDAILYLGPSPGANRELERAIMREMKIYYNPADIPFAPE